MSAGLDATSARPPPVKALSQPCECNLPPRISCRQITIDIILVSVISSRSSSSSSRRFNRRTHSSRCCYQVRCCINRGKECNHRCRCCGQCGGKNATTAADAVNRAGSKEAAKQALRAHLLTSSGYTNPASTLPAKSVPASSPLQPAEEFTVPPPFSYTSSSSIDSSPANAAAAPASADASSSKASSHPSDQEGDLSSDSFTSCFLAPSPLSPRDILRLELGAGVAEAVVASLVSGQLNLVSSSSPSSSSFSSSSSSSFTSSSFTSSSSSPSSSSYSSLSSSSLTSSPSSPFSTPLLPIMLLQCSTADYVVPPETSLSLIRSLHRLNSFLCPSSPASLVKLGGSGGREGRTG
ncbi:hypothetical protein CLOM_g20168 [Closterium sp. NIES-68]|nr:hypothetical protein CLOM_g20168 [Closterium sp. NIES-68]